MRSLFEKLYTQWDTFMNLISRKCNKYKLKNLEAMSKWDNFGWKTWVCSSILPKANRSTSLSTLVQSSNLVVENILHEFSYSFSGYHTFPLCIYMLLAWMCVGLRKNSKIFKMRVSHLALLIMYHV